MWFQVTDPTCSDESQSRMERYNIVAIHKIHLQCSKVTIYNQAQSLSHNRCACRLQINFLKPVCEGMLGGSSKTKVDSNLAEIARQNVN